MLYGEPESGPDEGQCPVAYLIIVGDHRETGSALDSGIHPKGDCVMAATSVTPELCPNCGKEWPSRFGKCPCNMQRVAIHKNAIVLEPGAGFLDSVRRLSERFEREACSSAEGCDLAGEPSPYPGFLADLDATIGFLKRYRRDLQHLAHHVHDWNSDDYCSICGADGRA